MKSHIVIHHMLLCEKTRLHAVNSPILQGENDIISLFSLFSARARTRLFVNIQMVKRCHIIEFTLHTNPWKMLFVSRKSPKLTFQNPGGICKLFGVG